MFSLGEVIEQLINPEVTQKEESETICECPLGALKFNPITDPSKIKYSPQNNCSKKFVCYYVATSKHKARISTQYHNKQKEHNQKRLQVLVKSKKETKIDMDKGQKSLLDFI